MAVDQHGWRRLALDMLGEQERRLAAGGFDQAALEIQRGESGHHLLFQIGAQLRAARRVLAFGSEGDAAVEFGEKRTGLEIVTGAGDGVGSGQYLLFLGYGTKEHTRDGRAFESGGDFDVRSS